MSIENLLSLTEKNFKKKHKDADFGQHTADNENAVDGLIVDNPLFEYILDRRFLPYGRCYLNYGKKGNGKTSLFFELAKLVQSKGGFAVWVETEHARDLDYARKQGVDLSRLIIPDIEQGSLQQACSYIEGLIKSLPEAFPDGNTPVLICLDSIAGCITDYELQDKIVVGEVKVGEHARIMSGFYRRITTPLSYEKCFFLALNQLKDQIGGMATFGGEDNAAEALIGGYAQRFCSTYQWKQIRIKDLIAKNEYGAERKVGSRHKMQGKRNKLGREGRGQEIEYDLYIDGGIDWYSPLVRKLAEEYTGIVGGKGSGWYTWKDESVVVQYKDDSGNVLKSSDVEGTKFREFELGRAISTNTPAKDVIRKAFGIRDLPSQAEVEVVEKERKTKRGRKRKEADETEDNVSSSPTAAPIVQPKKG